MKLPHKDSNLDVQNQNLLSCQLDDGAISLTGMQI